MGILENLEPTKVLKPGTDNLDILEHKAEEVLKKVGAVGSDLASEAFGKPAAEAPKILAAHKDLAVKPSVDHNTIGGSFSAFGTVLTNPIKLGDCGPKQLFEADDARSLVKSVGSLKSLASPEAMSGLALTRVAINKWESSDKSFSIQKSVSLKGDKSADELTGYLELFDKQVQTGETKGDNLASKPASSPTDAPALATNIEVVPGTETDTKGDLRVPTSKADLADLPATDLLQLQDAKHDKTVGAESSEHSVSDSKKQSKEYLNAAGAHSKVTVTADGVHYTAEKDGVVITDASQTNGISYIKHRGETATLDTNVGKLEFTSEQVDVLQKKGHQEITLKDGLKIEKSKGLLKLIDPKGKVLQKFLPHALLVEEDVAVVDTEADMQQASADMDRNQINVVISSEGNALAKLPDGTEIEVRHDNQAVIKTTGGDVLLVSKEGKIYILEDGKYVQLPSGESRGELECAVDGSVNIGQLRISETEGITFNGGCIDKGNAEIKFRNGEHHQRNVHLGKPDEGVKVDTGSQSISAVNGVVHTKTDDEKSWTMDLRKHTFDSKEVFIDAEETRIKHIDGRADTIIKNDNTVIFDEGKGPILHRDGGMRLDDQTTIDAKGNVTSGDWHASKDSMAAATEKKEAAQNLDGAVAQAAGHASANAMSVMGKATAGLATMGDLDLLGQHLTDIGALIGLLNKAGRSDLAAQLTNTYGLITQAIGYATPRAQAAMVEANIDKNTSVAA